MSNPKNKSGVKTPNQKAKEKKTPEQKKTGVSTPTKAEKSENFAKRASAGAQPENRSTVIAIAVTLSIVMLFGIAIGIAALSRRPFDFTNTNLSRYMKIDAEAYRNLTLTIQLDEVDDAAITRRIRRVLVGHKSEANNNGAGDRTGEITLGDEAYIWYRGYYLEDGERVEFDGGCNITDKALTDEDRILEIGSGSFVSGFEEGLLGHRGEQTSNLVRYTSGTVGAGEVVYLNMSAIFPDGTAYQNKLVRIDLADPTIAAKYGVGFRDRLIGAEVGSSLGTFTDELEGASVGLSTATYMNVSVYMRTTGEDTPLTVEARFPSVYENNPDLAGKTAYFEVYISNVVHCDTPDLTDAFITGTLGMSEEKLASYEGESLIDRYRSYVKEGLLKEYEEQKLSVSESTAWERVKEMIQVRRIPRRAIRPFYEDALASLEEDYLYYKSYYGYTSVEDYALDTLPLEDGQTYEEYLWQQAQAQATETMTFYFIMQKEDILPDAEKKAAYIQAAKDEKLVYYRDNVYAEDFNRDNYESDDEYNADVAQLMQSIVDYYGESYFEQSAYYDIIVERLLEYITIVIE